MESSKVLVERLQRVLSRTNGNVFDIGRIVKELHTRWMAGERWGTWRTWDEFCVKVLHCSHVTVASYMVLSGVFTREDFMKFGWTRLRTAWRRSKMAGAKGTPEDAARVRRELKRGVTRIELEGSPKKSVRERILSMAAGLSDEEFGALKRDLVKLEMQRSRSRLKAA